MPAEWCYRATALVRLVVGPVAGPLRVARLTGRRPLGFRDRVVDGRWGVDGPLERARGAVVEGLVEGSTGEAAAVELLAVDRAFDLDRLQAVGSDGGGDLLAGPRPV